MKPRSVMKSILLVILFCIIILFTFGEANQTLVSEIKPKNMSLNVLGADITENEGDIVVSGTDTYPIANGTFIRNGSIIVKDSATLIIQNANLTIQQSYSMQYNITIEDFAKVIVENSTVRSVYDLLLSSWGQSKIQITDSEIRTLRTEFAGISNVIITNSTVDDVEGGMFANISITKSNIGRIVAGCCPPDSTISVLNSTINKIEAAFNSTMIVVASKVQKVLCYDNATVRLLSSTVDMMWPPIDNGIIFVSWRLTVTVTLNARPIQGAIVEVFYLHNGSLVGTGTTGLDGGVELVLHEKIVNSTGTEYVGNYTVKTSYVNTFSQTDVELTEDKKIDMALMDAIKPTISYVTYIPETPTEGQNVTVRAMVVDNETGVLNVTLKYSTNNGSTWKSTPMHSEADSIYSATIPSQKAGVTVQFYLSTYDRAGNYAETSLYSYTIPHPPWWQQYWYVLVMIGIFVICGYILRRRMKARARLEKYLQVRV